jgi:hypothetical protein
VAAGAGAVRSVAAVHDAAVGALTTLPSLVTLATTEVVEPPGLQWSRVEVWSVAAALVLVAAGLVALRRPSLLPGRRRAAAGLPALVLAAGPSLYAALTAATTFPTDAAVTGHGWSDAAAAARAGAVLLGAGAVAVVRAGRPRTPLLSRPVARTAAVIVLVAAGVGLVTGFGEVELWTAPAAIVFLAMGALGLARVPALRSWRVLGPGLGLLLGPTLVLALPGDDVARVVGLTVVSAAVVVVGAARRLQAPVVLGGAVLAAHAVAQLGPWVVRTMAGQPRWVTLGLVGVVLLGLGATYERRLRELRSLRMRLGALR